MDESPGMWITAVPAFGPEDVGVLLAFDVGSEDPGECMVAVLLNRGHEGEEGVFYLLPADLSARYERTGDRLAVSLTASRQVLTHDLADHPGGLGNRLDDLPRDAVDDDRVILVRREIVTDFVPAEQDGDKQAVLLVHHEALHHEGLQHEGLQHEGQPERRPVLEEVLAQFDEGEAGIAVLNAD
ncbi:hypothetical protein ABZ348_12340 [Streptomyces sp. NPDC005963]|uniref:hypothetical protein n=1 Tax=Streptomyces sp. NPDC005963 TaxID=3156721 RepID=UPI0033DEAE64